MEELLQEDSSSEFAEGTVIQGRVIEKRDNGVLVDIGYKAEGFVLRDEFPHWDQIKAGDQIDVFLEMIEDDDHMPVLSAQRAILQKAWDHILEHYEEGGEIKGTVRHRVKGGLIVDVGVDAFLPGSQVDIGPVRNLEDYLGLEVELKILKINPERRNIVVSRREILERERAAQRATLLEELKPGQLRTGTVKNITDFGAFIDLKGMDGLLHITDMSWGRISHPSEVVKVGEELEVMVLDVDKERQRVSLGLKQKAGDPWETVDVKYPVGSRVNGRVVNVMPYGGFVELEEGVEGLIHVSEMSWTKRVTKASDVLSVGDEVEAMVLDIQKDARKISLGLRQTMENPWEVLAETFPKGSKIRGKVRNMTSYGAFVQIQDDLDGMIHVSDMSWTRKVNHPSEVLQKGQEVEAVILDIDPRNQRISLGLKQLADDPWSKIEDLYDVGSLVEGTVSKITSFGAFVELEHGIDGLIHISQLSNERVERVRDVVNVGDAVKARVIKIDADDRRIGLSLAAADDAELDYGQESHSGASASRDGGLRRGEHMVDMGDIFASALAERDQADRAADQSVEEVADEAVTEEAADDAVTEEAVTEETADEAVTEETAEEVADEAADDIDLGTPTEQVDDNTEDAALADVSDSSTEEPADDEEDRNRTPA
jgi:small subunit ribosomal protein S1